MGHSTRASQRLHALIRMMVPWCQRAEREHPRTGPGRRPEIPEWVMLVLIAVAIAKRRRSKSSQYRFLEQHRSEWLRLLGTSRFPSRSTYFDRYHRAHRLYQEIVKLLGRRLLDHRIGDARSVAVDKSLLRARGPEWPKRMRKVGKVRRGVDRESAWGYSQHHGWLQGYSYEVVVCAGKQGVVVPLLASVGTANCSEHRSFPEKIPQLPAVTKYVLADRGYDANDHAEAIEWDQSGRATGRRFLCPQVNRRGERGRTRPRVDRHVARREPRARREERNRWFQTPRCRRLYARRQACCEPFNEWFKASFELHEAWHHGLDNNRTQILASIFLYQLLVLYNHRHHRHHARIRWILDGL